MNKRQIPILFLRDVAPLLVLGCAEWFVDLMGPRQAIDTPHNPGITSRRHVEAWMALELEAEAGA
ncbi:hypothetical protein Pla52o_50280 [Novipirellula galeiformis]|uniref:Uncharacterized protein n=1 Tax=Novipirellula galeiformis TaxID=2528004 RepID=A0A5C6BYV6_9BACT|nr:hypothetical protein [Novipirellula galeiformis]TWU17473.1 hypothetical protein Pla52o_50280 [Novipirellula galeiformis]